MSKKNFKLSIDETNKEWFIFSTSLYDGKGSRYINKLIQRDMENAESEKTELFLSYLNAKQKLNKE